MTGRFSSLVSWGKKKEDSSVTFTDCIIHRLALVSNKMNQTFTYNPHRNKVISFTTNRPFSTRYLRQICAEMDCQHSEIRRLSRGITRWFKYDRDCNRLVYTQIVSVIFEPPCIWKNTELKKELTFLWIVLLHSHHTVKTTPAFTGLRILQIYFQSWLTLESLRLWKYVGT